MTRRHFLVAVSNNGSTARPVRPGEPVARYERVMKSDFLQPRTPQTDGTVHEVPCEYSIEHVRAIREGELTDEERAAVEEQVKRDYERRVGRRPQ